MIFDGSFKDPNRQELDLMLWVPGYGAKFHQN